MKKIRNYIILILAILFLVFASILFINKRIKINPVFAAGYELRGVDVSHYQGTIKWDRLAEQDLDFAFIKATEGSSYLDECFYDNWQAAEETDLYIGAYHFFSFDSEGEKQAEFYIDTVGDLYGKLAPVIDMEFYGNKESNPPNREEVAAQLGKMLTALEEHYQIKPVIYTTYKVYNNYIKGEFEEYPLWIRNVYYPPVDVLGGKWAFWQYLDTAVLEGYEGDEKYIDMNVFNGTKAELEELVVRCADEPESFCVYDDIEKKEEEISLSHCNPVEYDNDQIKIFSYFGQKNALFIWTPEKEKVIYPIVDFYVDQEKEAVWVLTNKDSVQISKIDLRQDSAFGETLILDQEEIEKLIGDVYGLPIAEGQTDFWDLRASLSGKKEDNGEIVLSGEVFGIYKGTDHGFYIVYEVNRESETVRAKGYLQNLSINPLYQEFLFHNLTAENFSSENGAEKFVLIDTNEDGKEELIFSIKKTEETQEQIYVLEEQEGKLICNDFFETNAIDEKIIWFDCKSFLDIPTEKCKEYKSRDEVFDAVISGDFSVVASKYDDPDGLVEELEKCYVLSTDRTQRCDIDEDGFEELLFLSGYEGEDLEMIDFILDYRNGSAVCVYFDWCDGMEWLSLGDEGNLIHCLSSNSEACTYYGYLECALNARGIKDIDYTGFGLQVCNVYELRDAGLWWWDEQLPEITQEGVYYVKLRTKNVEEINSSGTARGMVKELISKEEFLMEYKELTGKEFPK